MQGTCLCQPSPARRLASGFAPINLPFTNTLGESKAFRDGPQIANSAFPNQASPSWPSSRFPQQVPEASGGDTKQPSRGWGHTGSSPSNVVPPTPTPSLPLRSPPLPPVSRARSRRLHPQRSLCVSPAFPHPQKHRSLRQAGRRRRRERS